MLAALVGYWLLAVCSSLILLVAALAAPALRSVRALESGDGERRRRWLRYWAVYAVVATVSIVSDPLQGLIPGYWTAKVGGIDTQHRNAKLVFEIVPTGT